MVETFSFKWHSAVSLFASFGVKSDLEQRRNEQECEMFSFFNLLIEVRKEKRKMKNRVLIVPPTIDDC